MRRSLTDPSTKGFGGLLPSPVITSSPKPMMRRMADESSQWLDPEEREPAFFPSADIALGLQRGGEVVTEILARWPSSPVSPGARPQSPKWAREASTSEVLQGWFDGLLLLTATLERWKMDHVAFDIVEAVKAGNDPMAIQREFVGGGAFLGGTPDGTHALQRGLSFEASDLLQGNSSKRSSTSTSQSQGSLSRLFRPRRSDSSEGNTSLVPTSPKSPFDLKLMLTLQSSAIACECNSPIDTSAGFVHSVNINPLINDLRRMHTGAFLRLKWPLAHAAVSDRVLRLKNQVLNNLIGSLAESAREHLRTDDVLSRVSQDAFRTRDVAERRRGGQVHERPAR